MSFEDRTVIILAYIVSNIVGVILLITALKKPIIARWLYLILFGWAAYTNLTTAISTPAVYLNYANFTFLPVYKSFIQGFFSRHIAVIVTVIACCQLLVCISMALKGVTFKLGCIGGIVFLIAITPLGVGAAFPATLAMAAGMYLLFKNNKSTGFIWQRVSLHKSHQQ